MKVWIICYRHKGTNDDYAPVANQQAYLEDELERAKNTMQYLENMNNQYEYRVLLFSEGVPAEDLEGQDFEDGDEDFDEEEVEEEAQPA